MRNTVGGSPRVRTLGDLLAADIAPPEPLLGRWLVQRNLVMVYAPTGVGKSLLATSMALAVAGGGTLFDWAAPEPRRVLIVDGEMDAADIRERAETLLAAAKNLDASAARTNLAVLARQDQEPGFVFPDLGTTVGQDAVIKVALEHGAELVVLDNLSTLATLEDENAATGVAPIVDLLQRLKLHGMAVVLVHHSRKAAGTNGSYRGSQALSVVLNAIIRLEPAEGEIQAGGASFDLVFEKLRALRDATTLPLRATLEPARGTTGAAKWRHEQSPKAMLARLVQLVLSGCYATQEGLAQALGMSTGWVSAAKRQSIAAGLIEEADWKRAMKAAGGQRATEGPTLGRPLGEALGEAPF